MLKKIVPFLKFGFVGVLIYFLVSSGKLDFSLINKLFAAGPYWALGFLIFIVQDFGGAWRWKTILEVQAKEKLPYLSVVKLTWIGLFFNTFLPGAVTGDFIKLVYARDLDPSLSKTFLVISSLFDRVMGLIGLLMLMGIFSIVQYDEVVALSPDMKNLIHFNFALFAGGITFLSTIFAPTKIQELIKSLVNNLPKIGPRLSKTLDQVWSIGARKDVVLLTLFQSLCLQGLNVLAFWTITHSFYGSAEIPLRLIYTFVPIGMIAIAIPISPQGAGVGHFIFDKLFVMVGVQSGASLFNLHFLILITVNLLGFIPYLMAGKKHSLKEAESFGAQT